jgi:hypothetical protein
LKLAESVSHSCLLSNCSGFRPRSYLRRCARSTQQLLIPRHNLDPLLDTLAMLFTHRAPAGPSSSRASRQILRHIVRQRCRSLKVSLMIRPLSCRDSLAREMLRKPHDSEFRALWSFPGDAECCLSDGIVSIGAGGSEIRYVLSCFEAAVIAKMSTPVRLLLINSQAFSSLERRTCIDKTACLAENPFYSNPFHFPISFDCAA